MIFPVPCLLFGRKSEENPSEKARIFLDAEPPKSLGKKGKRSKNYAKARNSWQQNKQGNPPKTRKWEDEV